MMGVSRSLPLHWLHPCHSCSSTPPTGYVVLAMIHCRCNERNVVNLILNQVIIVSLSLLARTLNHRLGVVLEFDCVLSFLWSSHNQLQFDPVHPEIDDGTVICFPWNTFNDQMKCPVCLSILTNTMTTMEVCAGRHLSSRIVCGAKLCYPWWYVRIVTLFSSLCEHNVCGAVFASVL